MVVVTRKNILKDKSSRDNFVQGVKLLKQEQLEPNWPSTYDIFVIWHYRAMMTLTPSNGTGGMRNAAHSGPVFLPWHRWMLLLLEKHIQRVLKNESFGLPYWSWGVDGDLPENLQSNSPIWSDDCMGGTGDPIKSGPFAEGLWRIRFRQQFVPNVGFGLGQVDLPLTRNLGTKTTNEGFKISLPNSTNIKNLVHNNSQALIYDNEPWNTESTSFRNDLEGSLNAPPSRMHNAVHVWVGGDMAFSTSPNDPVFFLNHCNVDRIWSGWHSLHPNSFYLPSDHENSTLNGHRLNDLMYYITLNEKFDPLYAGRARPLDMMDISSRYKYDSYEDFA
jgi:tyrosinase